jgi:hypothetical protein
MPRRVPVEVAFFGLAMTEEGVLYSVCTYLIAHTYIMKLFYFVTKGGDTNMMCATQNGFFGVPTFVDKL